MTILHKWYEGEAGHHKLPMLNQQDFFSPWSPERVRGPHIACVMNTCRTSLQEQILCGVVSIVLIFILIHIDIIEGTEQPAPGSRAHLSELHGSMFSCFSLEPIRARNVGNNICYIKLMEIQTNCFVDSHSLLQC